MSICVQLVYHYDGKDYPSEIAYFDEQPTAISSVRANGKADQVKYYGLDGRELNSSFKGVAAKAPRYTTAFKMISHRWFSRGLVSLMMMNSTHGTTDISKKSVIGDKNNLIQQPIE